MNNVLNSLIKKSLCTGAKALIDELTKLDSKELTDNVAELLNDLLKGILVMRVDDKGNANINIDLSADQIKFLLQEISKEL